MGTKHIVGFSGGIDSQACARWVLNRYPAEDVLLMNSDAGGNEHPFTEKFVKWYSRRVHRVIQISAVVGDLWITPGFAETKGLESDAPLSFERMVELKGRPPSRTAQFCTETLKLRPQKRWIAEHFGPAGQYAGCDYIRYTGVRREEGQGRADTPLERWDTFYDCPLIAPIFDWLKQMCFDYVRAHGERVNPLYSLGFNRVGCAPCINSSKADILNWAQRFPEIVEKLRRFEARTGKTFFPPVVPNTHHNSIDEVVAWAHTKRGGKELAVLQPLQACESKYGLCA